MIPQCELGEERSAFVTPQIDHLVHAFPYVDEFLLPKADSLSLIR